MTDDAQALPLDGVLVLDLTRMLPGAVVTRQLVDLGARCIKVEDPVTGDPILDGQVDRRVGALPSWHVFGSDSNKGFLVYGEDLTDLRMVGLSTGKTLWSHDTDEKVRDIVPLQDGERFIAVRKEGIRMYDSSVRLRLPRS